jgi:hypothetical protein
MESLESKLPAVRSIAWLDGGGGFTVRVEQDRSGKDEAFAAWKSVNQSGEKNAISKLSAALRGLHWTCRARCDDLAGAVSPRTRATI